VESLASQSLRGNFPFELLCVEQCRGVCRNEVANPECREVADKAHATLMRVGAKGKVATQTDEDKATESKVPPPPRLAFVL